MKKQIVFYLSLLCILCIISIVAGCKEKKKNVSNSTKTSQPIKNDFIVNEPTLSNFVIDLIIDADTIVTLIKRQLPDPLYKDEGDPKITASVRENIDLTLIPNGFQYLVPIDLILIKDTGFGLVEGTGSLELQFQTNYVIDSDWNLKATTYLMSHNWLVEPKMKIGFVNISLSLVKDRIINEVRVLLPPAIDEQINKVDLRSLIQVAWEEQQKPILMSDDFDFWLTSSPKDLKVSSFNLINSKQLNLKIAQEFYSQAYLGEPRATILQNKIIPNFKPNQKVDEAFNIGLLTHLPYPKLSRLAAQQMIDQEFSANGKTVKIQGINITGNNDHISVDVDVYGDLTGSLVINAIPYVNSENGLPQVKDVNVKIDTKNVLYKNGAWLFKKEISKRFEQAFNEALKENFDYMKDEIRKHLEAFNPFQNFSCKGHLSELEVAKAYWSDDELTLELVAKGFLSGKLEATMK